MSSGKGCHTRATRTNEKIALPNTMFLCYTNLMRCDDEKRFLKNSANYGRTELVPILETSYETAEFQR